MEQVAKKFLDQAKVKFNFRIVVRSEDHDGRVDFRFRNESCAWKKFFNNRLIFLKNHTSDNEPFSDVRYVLANGR